MKWKKILCLGMAVVLMCANPAMIGNAQEAESDLNTHGDMETTDPFPFDEEYDYKELEDGTLSIVGYHGSELDIVIPAEHNGRKVTRIDSVNGGGNRTELTSVTISEGIKVIGESVFEGCAKLKEVHIPNTVISIEYGAFGYCFKLEEISIPDSVTSIGQWTFGYSGLKRINIPGNVKDIGIGAFDGCMDLTEINISEGVENIGNRAFNYCTSLQKINIPQSVSSIGTGIFNDCGSLNEITVDADNQYYVSAADGILYDKNITRLVCCPAKKEGVINIPDSVKNIDDYAFAYCGTLKEIKIPKNVINIGNETFYGADNMILKLYRGSYAEIYAKERQIPYTYIEEVCEHHYTQKVTKTAACEKPGEKTKTCTLCGNTSKEVIPATGHTIVTDPEIPATCKKEGKTKGSHCSVCNKVITTQKKVPKKNHQYKKTTQKASLKKNGSVTEKCSVCGATRSMVIYYPKTIKLSREKYIYSGKAQKISLIVKDSKGKDIPSSNYTVNVSGNRKNAGIYTVTVKFKGNYSGSVKKDFRIQPKGTSLSGLKAKAKGFTIKWKKQTSQTSGYEIQYSTDKNFKKDVKLKNVKKNKTISQSVSKLKAKKKYYVRIRTYKTVRVNGKNKNVYSDWSKTKSVTTKK